MQAQVNRESFEVVSETIRVVLHTGPPFELQIKQHGKWTPGVYYETIEKALEVARRLASQPQDVGK
jgi:hypothetical protein